MVQDKAIMIIPQAHSASSSDMLLFRDKSNLGNLVACHLNIYLNRGTLPCLLKTALFKDLVIFWWEFRELFLLFCRNTATTFIWNNVLGYFKEQCSPTFYIGSLSTLSLSCSTNTLHCCNFHFCFEQCLLILSSSSTDDSGRIQLKKTKLTMEKGAEALVSNIQTVMLRWCYHLW